MRVCILGSGLSSLTLAKALVNKNIYVDIFFTKEKQKKIQSVVIMIMDDKELLQLIFFKKF